MDDRRMDGWMGLREREKQNYKQKQREMTERERETEIGEEAGVWDLIFPRNLRPVLS